MGQDFLDVKNAYAAGQIKICQIIAPLCDSSYIRPGLLPLSLRDFTY